MAALQIKQHRPGGFFVCKRHHQRPRSYFAAPASAARVVRARIIDKDNAFNHYTATIAINHTPALSTSQLLYEGGEPKARRQCHRLLGQQRRRSPPPPSP